MRAQKKVRWMEVAAQMHQDWAQPTHLKFKFKLKFHGLYSTSLHKSKQKKGSNLNFLKKQVYTVMLVMHENVEGKSAVNGDCLESLNRRGTEPSGRTLKMPIKS